MNHNYQLKGMFASSLARRVGWLGVIAMLGVGLLCPASAQNTNRNQKVPPRTPQQKQKVEIEKTTGVENSAAVKMLNTGTVKGKIDVKEWWRVPQPVFWAPLDGITVTARLTGTIAPLEAIAGTFNMQKIDTDQGDGTKALGSYGDFAINNLAPGTYVVEFKSPQPPKNDPKWQGCWYKNASKRVTIRANQTTTVDLKSLCSCYFENPFLGVGEKRHSQAKPKP